MSDLTIKRHDTWPPLRMALMAPDDEGVLKLVDLTEADSAKLLMKMGATLVTGPVLPISPPDLEGMNAEYQWAEGDTNVEGDYAVEVEVTWDSDSVPPEVQTFPNSGTQTITIQPDQG